jgi:uncharacterized protein (DUF924 family)
VNATLYNVCFCPPDAATVNNRFESILEFWFGAFPDAYHADPDKTGMWFRHGADYDGEIFTRFGADYFAACNGELDHWAESPRGRLALIVLLDQFSRHIHRGGAEAFAQDARAQELTLDGIARGDDQALHPVERCFFYLPLEHAEDASRQHYSVQAFEQLLADVPAPHKDMFDSMLDYARRHQRVIERFGRFPELNEILGRESTAQENDFINDGKYAFL